MPKNYSEQWYYFRWGNGTILYGNPSPSIFLYHCTYDNMGCKIKQTDHEQLGLGSIKSLFMYIYILFINKLNLSLSFRLV